MPAKQRPHEPDEFERAIFEAFIASVHRMAADAQRLSEQVPALMNAAYVQGVRDARKASTGRDPMVPGGENDA
jgi:hypothetical protein